MLRAFVIAAFVLAAGLGAISMLVDPAWIGITDEPGRILVIGGTGVVAMLCLLMGLSGAAMLIVLRTSGHFDPIDGRFTGGHGATLPDVPDPDDAPAAETDQSDTRNAA